MVLRRVDVRRSVARPAEECWAILRNFCAPWHPMVDTMRAEQGGRVRAFTVGGEAGAYRERLTWLSDSEMRMRYSHVEGIVGADRYDAEVCVETAAKGAMIRWSVEIEAPSLRCDEIAAGTEAVFLAGIEALMDAPLPPVADGHPIDRPLDVKTIDGDPRLSVLTTNVETETLCLFLHGIGGRKENWATQLAALPPGIGGAALDFRGYGDSDLGPNQTTVNDHCDDILRVVEALGAKRLVLCGLSFGAWLATSFAMRHPARLSGLVLAGGCTGMSEAAAEERQAFRESREVPLDQGKTPADFALAVVDVIAGPEASAATRAELAASMAAIPAATYRDALNCFTNPPETFDFAYLTMPVLMITGSHDRLAPPSEIRSVAERIWTQAPGGTVRFEELKGAGHVCNLEAPERFNQIFAEFLAMVRV